MKNNKRTFVLESGVKTTTAATKEFFGSVKKFYLTLRKNSCGYYAIFSSRNYKKKLYTTTIANIAEVLAARYEQYIRIVTRNSVINLWTDEIR